MTERDDDFLARWSRRKSEAREGLRRRDEAGDGDPEVETRQAALPGERDEFDAEAGDRAPEDQPPPGAEAGDGTAEDDFSDVDFEALDFESDYGRFMKDGVPDAIRRRALKQLWRSNPVLANLDGLNDYDDDFTDAALAVEVLETAYKVGRGYLTDEDLAKDASEDEAPGDADVPPEVEVAEAGSGAEPDEEAEDGGSAAAPDAGDAATAGEASRDPGREHG